MDTKQEMARHSAPVSKLWPCLSEKWLILKNVVIVSVAFKVLFISFQSMASLQSSINKDAGLGAISLAIIYASLILSSMFVPSFVIAKIKTKWTMVASMACYSFYIAAQFYPTFATLVPAAVVIGLGAAPLWISKCSYLTLLAGRYGEITGSPVEPVIVRFFGIFFFFFQCSSIWGNVISSVVLASGSSNDTISTEALSYCGSNYCPAPTEDVQTEPVLEVAEEIDNFQTDRVKIYTLATIYLACSLAAPIIIATLVDPVSSFSTHEGDSRSNSVFHLLFATIRHCRIPRQLLIIPITFWSGMEQGYFGADFTAGFVTCAFGVQTVGLVLIVYGVCDAICSFLFGLIINRVGRIPIFLFGAIINFAMIATQFLWTPNFDEEYVVFIIAAFWGVADAIWQTQINALYGSVFKGSEEAAFSNYRLWESLGFLVAYLLQSQVCVGVKLWILLANLIVGMAGYLVMEVLESRRNNRIIDHKGNDKTF